MGSSDAEPVQQAGVQDRGRHVSEGRSVNPVAAAGTAEASPTEAGLAKWVYFSFITLTTVGYGDITPITPAARNLVILEALIGQFFVAVLVARLVRLLRTQLTGDWGAPDGGPPVMRYSTPWSSTVGWSS